MAEEENVYATAANFGGHEEAEPKRPWVKEVTVPESIKRKYPSKHYVYKVVVKWTNGAETVIYRQYSLFFDFVVKLHELVNKLIQEKPNVVEADLQLPELPSKVLFGRSQTHQVAEKRRRKVEDFCQQLILLPPEISESTLVLGFFNTWPDDTLLRHHSPAPSSGDHVISAPVLVSSRSDSPPPLLKLADDRRSSIIETTPPAPPTQDKVDTSIVQASSTAGAMESVITHPDEMEHLEQYRVLGDYERKDSHQVDLYIGRIVHVIEKHDTGWWMVMSEDEQGYAPAAYLESLDGSSEDKDVYPESHTNEVYEAMEAYIPVSEDEVGFKPRDRIEVIAKSMDGWWNIRCNGQTGFAPAALIRPITAEDMTQPANFASNLEYQSERTIYEELNIHQPPPRRNTLNRSVVNHVPPGYLSPRSNPNLAGFVEENHIYCDPAEESGEDEEEEHIYKVPRLSSSTEVPKVNGVSQPSRHGDPEAGASRSGSASSAVSQDDARRGSANSQRSIESPKPFSPALQANTQSSASERDHVLEESPAETQTVYENVDDAKDLSPTTTQSTQSQANNRGQSNRNSGKKLLPKPPPPTKPKPKPQQKHKEQDVYESMDSENTNQGTTTSNSSSSISKQTIQFENHSVDDYEDIDAEINGLQTALLPALDDYVDMAVGNHDNMYINPDDLKRTGSHDELLERLKSTSSTSSAPATPLSKPAPPPRVPNKPSTQTSKISLTKSFSIDPLPPVFGEDDYIDMDPVPGEAVISERQPPLTSPVSTPNKPRSARPLPPPPYTPKKLEQELSGKGAKKGKKSKLVRAKSMEDLLSAARDEPDMPRLHSPPFLQESREDCAPPLPSRIPRQGFGNPTPFFNHSVDSNIPAKPKPGKTRALCNSRKPMTPNLSNGEFKWPDLSHRYNPPPLPKTKPVSMSELRSVSPPSRQSISPPIARERSPHPPLLHTMSESNITTNVIEKTGFVAKFSFNAQTDGCVSFTAGEKCELVRQAKDSGWWLVKVGEKVGWTPANYWKEEKRERSVTNAFHPHPPPPMLRKPRSHTVAEISTSSNLENSLQDSLQSSQGSFTLSSSIDEEISPLSRSVEAKRQPSVTSPPPVMGAKPVIKGKAPPPKPKPIPDAGSPLNQRRKTPDKPGLPQRPQKYSGSSNSHVGSSSSSPPGQRRSSGSHSPTPPPLPPANATRRLGSQDSQTSVGGVTSPNRLGDGRPTPALPEGDGDGEYVMLKDASTEVTSIETAVWFAGKMERVQAEHFLMEHGRQREFLIRERTTKDGYYALSVRYHYNIRHFNIDPTPDGQYAMGTLVFPSIQEIISHYQQNSLFIHDNQHVTLGQAVKKRGRVSGASGKANGV